MRTVSFREGECDRWPVWPNVKAGRAGYSLWPCPGNLVKSDQRWPTTAPVDGGSSWVKPRFSSIRNLHSSRQLVAMGNLPPFWWYLPRNDGDSPRLCLQEGSRSFVDPAFYPKSFSWYEKPFCIRKLWRERPSFGWPIYSSVESGGSNTSQWLIRQLAKRIQKIKRLNEWCMTTVNFLET